MSSVRDWMRGRLSGRMIGLTMTAAVWAVLLLGVAVPHWQKVQNQNIEIQKLEKNLADLDRWTVAGLWLEQAVASREREVEARWSRLFPAARDREQVFLALARAADHSGVEAFQLEEISEPDMTFIHEMVDDEDPGDDMHDQAELTDRAVVTPQVAPGWYCVKASFVGDYARTAAFLAQLAGIDRAVGVHKLVIRPARTGLDVEVELRIYVHPTHVS
jgi:hypothetical protein